MEQNKKSKEFVQKFREEVAREREEAYGVLNKLKVDL